MTGGDMKWISHYVRNDSRCSFRVRRKMDGD